MEGWDGEIYEAHPEQWSLFVAIRRRRLDEPLEEIRTLVEQHPDWVRTPLDDGTFALHWALRANASPDLVRYLLEL